MYCMYKMYCTQFVYIFNKGVNHNGYNVPLVNMGTGSSPYSYCRVDTIIVDCNGEGLLIL
jgi:hypothetical protein